MPFAERMVIPIGPGHFDQPLTHFFLGNKYVRVHGLDKKGDTAPSHAHKTDHDSVVICGMVALIVDDKREHHGPGSIMKILAGKIHQFEALSDCVIIACVHDDVEAGLGNAAESLVK